MCKENNTMSTSDGAVLIQEDDDNERLSDLINSVRSRISTASGTSNSGASTSSPGNKLPQFIGALTATLSALATGLALGWTSPIFEELKNGQLNNIVISDTQLELIGSLLTLGAFLTCTPTGFLCDALGRKKVLLLLLLPFEVGWLLIIFSRSVLFIYFGRFIIGMAAGACCVAAPMYVSEVAHAELRGALGMYFQLMVAVGIFLAYLLGKYLNPFDFTVCCAAVPVVFFLSFLSQPESPAYYLKKNLNVEAVESLRHFRGVSDDEIYTEIVEIIGIREMVPGFQFLYTKAFKKALLISLMLMFFQQFSGINAVMFYTSEIFSSSGVSINPKTATIFVGAFQIIATFISSLLIDKLGRRVLLCFSGIVMALSSVLLAVYFTLKYRINVDEHVALELKYLPIFSLCLFVVAYSVGLGPIPWLMSSELCERTFRSLVNSSAGTLNWFLAFLITKFYIDLSNAIGLDVTYYFFGAMSALSVIFTFFFIPETKGKSVSDIQDELNERLI